MSGEVRILLAGLIWLPLLAIGLFELTLLVGLFELRTKVLVTLLTELASFNHDSFRSDTCQISVGQIWHPCVYDMLDKICAKYVDDKYYPPPVC